MTPEKVRELLKNVLHPGMEDKDIVSLGLVDDIRTDGDNVTVVLAFPKRRDPLAEYLVGSVRATL